MPRFDCTTAAGIRDAIAQTHRSDTLSRAWSLTYYRLYPGPLNEAIIKKLSEDIGDPFPFLKLAEDQRRVVLGFLLGVAWRPSPPPPPPSFFMAPVLPDRRVRFSALASIRTMTFHSRSIKAVCSAVASRRARARADGCEAGRVADGFMGHYTSSRDAAPSHGLWSRGLPRAS